MGIPLVQDAWAKFNEREPGLIPDELRSIVERTFVNDTLTWLMRLNERPWTFIHGDYELDNMLFVDDEIVVLDWQLSGKSFPGQDLSFFLTACATDETVAAERELLDAYRAALAAAGGPSWTHDEVVEDMAFSMLYWVAGQTITAMGETASYGDKAERMQRRFRKFLTGAIDGAMRWDTPAACRSTSDRPWISSSSATAVPNATSAPTAPALLTRRCPSSGAGRPTRPQSSCRASASTTSSRRRCSERGPRPPLSPLGSGSKSNYTTD